MNVPVHAQSTPGRRDAGKPDLDKIAFDLEYDQTRIFRFVADSIRYEPYAGILRGPIGVLWGMSGNSIDQALLLSALLKIALVDCRIVVGEIDDKIAARLADSASIDADAVLAEHKLITSTGSLSSNLGDVATPVASPEAQSQFGELAKSAAALRPKMIEMSRSQLTSVTALLGEQFESAGVTINSVAATVPQREKARHAWVQVSNGTNWLDLDPSVPDAEVGVAYGVHPAPIISFDDSEFHQVKIRALGDFVRGGAVSQEELLSYSGHSADLVGAAITFFHSKPQWIGAAIDEALGGTDQYQPFLQVGTQLVQGTRFAFGGQGGAAGAFGDVSSREGEPVAEWLEITVQGPDVDSLIEMRPVFDRLGDEVRESGAVSDAIASMPPIETVTLDEDSGATFLPLLGASNITVVSAPVPLRYFAQDWAINDTAADLAFQNHGYHYLRDMLGAELAKDTRIRFFRDRPTVTLLDIGVVFEESAQKYVTSLDLVQPSHAVRPLTGMDLPTNAGLIEGVLNNVAERNLLEVTIEAVPAAQSLTFTSVGALFEAAAAQGIALRTLKGGELLPADLGSALSAAARTRISAWLDQGFAIVVPERPVDLNGISLTGWWAVDPATGRTIDRTESGRGVEMGEEATLFDVVIETAHKAYILGSCIASIVGVVVAVVFVISDFGSDGALAGAVAGGVHGFAMCSAAIVSF